MRIITIDLINRMNTEEGQTPEFDIAWDEVVSNLDKHNESLAENCSLSVKTFIKNVVLFNCPLFCFGDTKSEYMFVVGSIDTQQIYFLSYELVDEIKTVWHIGPAFDKNDSVTWLYDEIHQIENHYEHHIVLSDGRELFIPFVFFHCRKTMWFEDQ